jgi:hypothetical protein
MITRTPTRQTATPYDRANGGYSLQNRALSRGLKAAKLAYSHHGHWGMTVL